jgi:hypothetical protein
MGLKSPSDGCWDGRDKTTLHRKKEGLSTQDILAEPGLGVNHPLQMERLPLMDMMSPGRDGRYLERVAVC